VGSNQLSEPETDYLKRRYEELHRPPLTLWGKEAEKHWRENLPMFYKGLKEANVLLPAVVVARENAKDRFSQLVDEGSHPEEAREVAKKEFLYLDPEPESQNQEPENELSESPLEDLANEQTATSAVESWLNSTCLPEKVATIRHPRKLID